jgi:Family of unknown function (DUF6527)
MIRTLQPVFVDTIPKEIEAGKLYISRKYETAIHKCCCGCGQKVVTPFSPTGWQLFEEGDLVSLRPSIGNWSFPCQSHYWITRSKVEWSYQMTQEEIQAGRRSDRRMKERYYRTGNTKVLDTKVESVPSTETSGKVGFWEKLKRWLFG